MNTSKQLTAAHKITIIALIVSCIAVIIQKMMGVTNYPLIPPAIIIALIAAAGLYFAPWKKWAAVIGVLVPLSLTVGPAINRWHEKLWQPDATGFLGIWLQWVSIVIALIGACYVAYLVFTKKK